MRTRDAALAALAEQPVRRVVIGGGITGAGVALDAASRGYSVALVEQADFASGTSSRSSKLVHGGLRYLQNFDLGLVREALLERQLMVRLAPHLVRPLPFVVPAFDGSRRPDRLTGIGLNMYDVMAAPSLRGRRSARRAAAADGESDWSPARHRLIDGEEVARAAAGASATGGPSGGYLFYDCQTDDARLVLTVLGEAERFGAVCANRLRVTELRQPGGSATEVDGARPRERAARSPSAPRTWSTPPACGPTGSAPTSCTPRPSCPRSPPAAGSHVILRREDLPLDAGAIVPVGDGRSIFALPWLGRTLIGTTDNNYEGDVEHVQPSLAGHRVPARRGQRVLRDVAGRATTSTGAYAGVRPLISSGDSRKSVDISRKAELYETSSGLITITGGKLTTWRRMARLVVDRIVERDGREAPCRTHEIPLGAPVEPAALPRVDGVPEGAYAMLAGRYGHAAERVLQTAAADPASWPRRSSPACPTCWPRRPSPPATSRRARSATCCCAAPGSGCWPDASSAPPAPARRAASPRRWAPRWAGTPRALPPRSRASPQEARAEGIAVALDPQPALSGSGGGRADLVSSHCDG